MLVARTMGLELRLIAKERTPPETLHPRKRNRAQTNVAEIEVPQGWAL